MPNRESKAIGEYGYLEKEYKCLICGETIMMKGYFWRDFDGYPIFRNGVRRYFVFPDKTKKEGLWGENAYGR